MTSPSPEPELLPEHAHRALLYVERLNAVGVYPDAAVVELLSSSAGPRPPVYDNPMFSGITSVMAAFAGSAGRLVRPGEPVVGWLTRMGWLTAVDKGLKLTDLGAALLAGLRKAPSAYQPQAEESTAVVLHPDDPFVYSQLTRTIAGAGEALLVDPYFKSDMLPWLHDATHVTRLLMSSKGSQRPEVELVALMLYEIKDAPNAGRVEVRATASHELHDRLILPTKGDVLFLGTSITGIGRHLSTVVPLPAVAADAMRGDVERLWDDAEPVEPRPLRRPGTSPTE